MIWIEGCGLKVESGWVSSDRERILKFGGAMFAVALSGYVLLYSLDSGARRRAGPWEVEFTTNMVSEPMLRIGQVGLGISNRVIVFTDERAPKGFVPETKRFGQVAPPGASVPFGRWVYHDLMYLPGVVTLELFLEGNGTRRHEVELMSRALMVNRKEHAWAEIEELRLTSSDKYTGAPPDGESSLRRQNSNWWLWLLAAFPVLFVLALFVTKGQSVKVPPKKDDAP